MIRAVELGMLAGAIAAPFNPVFRREFARCGLSGGTRKFLDVCCHVSLGAISGIFARRGIEAFNNFYACLFARGRDQQCSLGDYVYIAILAMPTAAIMTIALMASCYFPPNLVAYDPEIDEERPLE